MTYSSCQAKVEKLLESVPGVQQVTASLAEDSAEIKMDHHIPTNVLKAALGDHQKYQLSDAVPHPLTVGQTVTEDRSWLATYRPVLLIAAYLLAHYKIILSFSRIFKVK